jgi:hypothetical protein
MGLVLGFSVIIVLVSIVGLVIGGLMVFFSFKIQDKNQILAAILALLGMLLILGCALFGILFLMSAISILSYTN